MSEPSGRHRRLRPIGLGHIILLSLAFAGCMENGIDRETVVRRHFVSNGNIDSLNALTVGNGKFAMTVDVTGLQSFPQVYKNGIPLGTQSEWGWHSFPPERAYDINETLRMVRSHGREVPYAVQWPPGSREAEAANYIRQNPHRIHLASLGLEFIKSDGTSAKPEDFREIDQTLDLWNGKIISKYQVAGEKVVVVTMVHPERDLVAVSIESPLLLKNRVGLQLKYPYPTDQFLDEAAKFDNRESSRLSMDQGDKVLTVERTLDDFKYYTSIFSSSSIVLDSTAHGFHLTPVISAGKWSFMIEFSENSAESAGDFESIQSVVSSYWNSYWKSGGMMDFGATKDKRAKELERRMILSMYLTRVNCGGKTPPQETGLTYNSWYGKPHMEMAWWHGVHFALWGRPEILEQHMSWYFRGLDVARQIAERQGFEGVRWQKMTDPEGGETVSSIGSYLIWQQPHLIYFAELLYQNEPSGELVDKYLPLIQETADFMANYAWYDGSRDEYILGPGLIAAQERFDPDSTINTVFELAYWKWGLATSQKWMERAGQERDPGWQAVIEKLSPLPERDGLYLAAETAADSYSDAELMTDHPMVLGIYGMLPGDDVEFSVMERTFEKIWQDWQWEDTWGWDFPMLTMTAARLGKPEKAVEALLMPVTTNTYLKNGHNYQNETLRLYLPGNGGLLTALALMAKENTFPGDWEVQVEGINKMP